MHEHEIYQAMAQGLRQSKRVAITCHRQPDGDALGASLALALALKSLQVHVDVLLPTPAPRQYHFLPGLTDDGGSEWCWSLGDPEAAKKLQPYDVLMVLDVDVGDRILAVNAVSRQQTMMLDHHASSLARPGDLSWIDANQPCTGMMVETLIAALDVPLTEDIATCLYTAVNFDTGRFMHANTTPAVFAAAARYQEAGCPVAEVNRRLVYCRSETDLRAHSAGLQRLVVDSQDQRVAGITLNWDAIHAVGNVDEWGDLVEWPRSIIGVEVAYLIREQERGISRVSLRANPPYVVSDVAEYFGGGGHKQAAGCTLRTNAVTAAKELLPQLRRATNQVEIG